jgi:hypothetical protein
MVGRLENLPPREGRRVMKERQRERGREGKKDKERIWKKKEKKREKSPLPTMEKKTTHKKNIPRIGG